jgi:hypothetical protein
VFGRDGVFDEDDEKGVVQLVLFIRNPAARLELTLFDEGVGPLAAEEIGVGVYQRILDEGLIQVIAQQFVVGAPELIREAQLFAVVPERQSPPLSA